MGRALRLRARPLRLALKHDRTRQPARAVALVALAAFLGCDGAGQGTRATRTTVLDLITAFPATRAGGPTDRLHVGDPRDRVHFIKGWSAVDRLSDGRHVLWAPGTRASLWFDAGRIPTHQSAILESVTSQGTRRLPLVLVRLNGRMAGRLRLSPGEQEHQIDLPAQHQRPGRNTLEFLVPGGFARIRTGASRIGLLSIRFARERPAPPAPSTDGDRLVLPPGTSVTYVVDVPAGAALMVEHADGSVPALQIAVQADGRPARRLSAAPDAGSRIARVDLSAESGTFARLTVAAPDASGVSPRPAVLVRPRIEATGAPLTKGSSLAIGATRPNVVLYVADTLRADHLGCYGYARNTSPHLDRFARDGVLYEHAVAQASWTRPATASILTGRNPYEHAASSLMDALRPDVPTMAEMLGGVGYATAAFITNLNVAARFGFARGFGEYRHLEEREDRETVYVPAPELNQAAFAWLDAHREQRFFLYLHATDPHAPYRPPPEYAARFAPLRAVPSIGLETPIRRLLEDPSRATPADVAVLGSLYDAEVALLDDAFGALLDKLDALRVARRTLVIFVADHGEEFRDHGGFDHGRTLYQELVRVPLVIRLPGTFVGGRRIGRLVRQIDILPTVLATIGIGSGSLPGMVLPATDASPGAPDAVLETQLTGRRLTGLVTGRWKAVWDDEYPRADVELYALDTDPAERRNVAAEHPIIAAYARQHVDRARSVTPPAADTSVDDPAIERRLRALGYVE